jgi:uncharacterized oxidoreductase
MSMKTSHNTILITGGGSGIGFEIAKLFSQNGNQVIITGRNEEKLKQAAAKLQNVTPIAADVTKEADVASLVTRLGKDFPSLNVVVNNAGNASLHDLGAADGNAYEAAAEESLTNYLAIIRLNERLLPGLNKQPESAIVNVSSVVAFVPASAIPTYSASKAALHSYTQSLRIALAKTSKVKIFELMPPLVDTEFSKGIGGHKGIHPSVVAKDLYDAFTNDTYEIHVGNTADIYKLSLASPADALAAMNAGE